MLDQSISAWQEALKSLPAENLSDQETQLKTQFEEGLKLAEDQTKYFADVEGAQNRLVVVPSDRMNQLPWIKALNLEDVLTANNVLNTCVSRTASTSSLHSIYSICALSPGVATYECIQGTDGPRRRGVRNRSLCPNLPISQDFSEGVRYMKQIKKTPQGIQANLNVSPVASLLPARPRSNTRTRDLGESADGPFTRCRLFNP